MKLEEIQRIAVLGAGTMGPGIAQCYAMSGREVCLYDISESALVKARAMLLSNLDTFVDEELLTVEEADATYKRVSFTTVLAEALDGVQFVQDGGGEAPDQEIRFWRGGRHLAHGGNPGVQCLSPEPL